MYVIEGQTHSIIFLIDMGNKPISKHQIDRGG